MLPFNRAILVGVAECRLMVEDIDIAQLFEHVEIE